MIRPIVLLSTPCFLASVFWVSGLAPVTAFLTFLISSFVLTFGFPHVAELASFLAPPDCSSNFLWIILDTPDLETVIFLSFSTSTIFRREYPNWCRVTIDPVASGSVSLIIVQDQR